MRSDLNTCDIHVNRYLEYVLLEYENKYLSELEEYRLNKLKSIQQDIEKEAKISFFNTMESVIKRLIKEEQIKSQPQNKEEPKVVVTNKPFERKVPVSEQKTETTQPKSNFERKMVDISKPEFIKSTGDDSKKEEKKADFIRKNIVEEPKKNELIKGKNLDDSKKEFIRGINVEEPNFNRKNIEEPKKVVFNKGKNLEEPKKEEKKEEKKEVKKKKNKK